jgi:uncharacterized membrane protein YtjA (UPF0391 family)
VDLTGVIPPRRRPSISSAGPDFVPSVAVFFAVSSPGQPGTFVPKQDYFRSQCTAPVVARDAKQKVEAEFCVMLSWVVTFLIIALIAGILGFGGVAGASIEIAKIIFFIAVVLFLASAIVGIARGRSNV